jgi:hypothetical protein
MYAFILAGKTLKSAACSGRTVIMRRKSHFCIDCSRLPETGRVDSRLAQVAFNSKGDLIPMLASSARSMVGVEISFRCRSDADRGGSRHQSPLLDRN